MRLGHHPFRKFSEIENGEYSFRIDMCVMFIDNRISCMHVDMPLTCFYNNIVWGICAKCSYLLLGWMMLYFKLSVIHNHIKGFKTFCENYGNIS